MHERGESADDQQTATVLRKMCHRHEPAWSGHALPLTTAPVATPLRAVVCAATLIARNFTTHRAVAEDVQSGRQDILA